MSSSPAASPFSTLTSALTWPFRAVSPAPPSPPATPRAPSPSLSLTPLTLTGYSPTTKSHLLHPALAAHIRDLLPARLQLHSTWTLAYSLEQHGVSLATLFARAASRTAGYVLIVRSHLGETFGAFVNEGFRPTGRYYGTGECFLWKEKTGEGGGGAGFAAYPYSGVNEFVVLCEAGFLSVGGGEGRVGLWVDDCLEKGVTERCGTFGNEPLSEAVRGRFDVVGVEVWRIGAGEEK